MMLIDYVIFQITLHVHCCGGEEDPIDFGSLGQRSRSTLALCKKHCGLYFDCSLSPITFILYMQVVDDKRRAPIDFGSLGKNSRSTLAQATVFAQSLSNFTCKLIIRAGTLRLFILSHRVKGQGQLWDSVKTHVHGTGYSFCLTTFKGAQY